MPDGAIMVILKYARPLCLIRWHHERGLVRADQVLIVLLVGDVGLGGSGRMLDLSGQRGQMSVLVQALVGNSP